MGNSTCCAPSKNPYGDDRGPMTANLRKKDPFANLEGYMPDQQEMDRDLIDTYQRSNGSSNE